MYIYIYTYIERQRREERCRASGSKVRRGKVTGKEEKDAALAVLLREKVRGAVKRGEVRTERSGKE